MARSTGRDHSRVNLSIWNDDDWRDLTPPEQHLYLVLWTSAALSYCGAGPWHSGRIANLAAGWTADAVEAAAAGLSRRQFLLIDHTTDEFLLRSWVKHDGLWKTPNMAVSVANARAELGSRALRGVVVHEVAKLRRAHPESSSWTRDSVAEMLTQKAIDPASLPPFNPPLNPAPNPPANPYRNPSANPPANPYEHPAPNPPSNPAPTPSPSPTSITPTTEEGYVSTEGHPRATNEPPSKCARHIDDPNPPRCGACADARHAHDSWQTSQRRTAARAALDDRQRAIDDERAAIADCEMCDDDGRIRGHPRPCDHDPDAAERHRRGLAQVTAVLKRTPTKK